MNRGSALFSVVTKLNRSKVCFCITAIVFFCLILVLNIYYPICLDDWDYSFVFGESPARRIQSVSDIFLSGYNHYNQWGGRSVVHFIDQLLLFLGEPVASLLNSLAYIFFIYLIYCFCKNRSSLNVLFFILINTSVWFLMPVFFSTVIWLTGASNYLWGTLIILLFIYPYFRLFRTKKSKDSFSKIFLFFLAGIFAGWTNENTALGMIFIIISLVVYLKYKGEKIPVWAIAGLIAACIGYLLMILAPGNYVRMHQVLALHAQAEKSLFQLMPYRGYMILCNSWNIILIIYVSYAISVYAYIKQNKNKMSHDILFVSLLFFVGGNIAIWAMLGSPEFPLRSWFGIISFIIIAVGILLCNTELSYPLVSKVCCSLFLCGCLLFVVDYSIKCRDVYQFHSLMKKRVEFIFEEKKRGVKDIVISEQIVIPNVYPEFSDVAEYSLAWQNQAYLRYFDLNSIVYKPSQSKEIDAYDKGY